MKYEHLMTVAEINELKAIDAMAKDAKKLRAKFMNRLRQRAWRQRNAD
jgi:hypothetical protein